MPINPEQVASIIEASAPFPGGPTWPILCRAIGLSLATWMLVPSNVKITGVTAGSAGSGIVTGGLSIPPSPVLIASALRASGVNGTTVDLLSSAVAIGVSNALTGTARYMGSSSGVSAGTDVSKVTLANPVSLLPLLELNFRSLCASLGGYGPFHPGILPGLATGLAAMILLGGTVPGTGVVVPAGSVSPYPAVGTSPSSRVV